MPDESPNRATLALVDAKVGQVDTRVAGLESLIKAESAATRDMLADLKVLPVEVATLKSDLIALDARERAADEDFERRLTVDIERRLNALEAGSTADRNWRRTYLPSILLSAAVVVLSIIALFLNVRP